MHKSTFGDETSDVMDLPEVLIPCSRSTNKLTVVVVVDRVQRFMCLYRSRYR